VIAVKREQMYNHLSAPFDQIDISMLLGHLHIHVGVSRLALNRIAPYLVGHEQSVHISQQQTPSTVCEYGVPQVYLVGHEQSVHISPQQSSRSTGCEYGVPQVCLLGPLLFTLYI